LRCVDNFSPRVSDVEAFGASGFAHLRVSVETNDAAAAAISSANAAAISSVEATTAAGAAGSDPAQNRPTN
jgi:hypothetical protein